MTNGELVFVGANPGLVTTVDGRGTLAASLWRTEWSTHGAGDVAVLAGDALPHPMAVTSSPALASFLVHSLTRYFPEFRSFGLDTAAVTAGAVDFLELTGTSCHVRVTPADGPAVEIRMADPLDVRPVRVPRWRLGATEYTLETTLAPCGTVQVGIDGEPAPGGVTITSAERGPVSSAFVATGERWWRH